MKSKKKMGGLRGKNLILSPLFGLVALGDNARGQQEIIQPATPPVEAATKIAMTNDFQVFGPRPNATAPTPYEPFRVGNVVIRPHIDYQFIDAEGLLAAPSNHVNTYIQNISPGVLFNLGKHWSFDYTATIGYYSNTNFGTEFDHSLTLTGETIYTDWIFDFVQSAVISKSPQIETGGQTSEQTYSTAVTGHHENNEYITEDLGVYQSIQEVGGSGYENMRTWSTLDWLNYQPQPRFNMGIGAGAGYDNADFGPDSVFEEAEARLNWRATDKVSFQLNGGVEESEFIGGQGANDLFSPIFGGTIQYQPFNQTQISLFASRSVSPSIFVGQYSEDTVVGASFSQRLLGQIYLNLSGSYNNQQYIASSIDALADRTDKFYSLSLRVSHSFLKRGTASVFYQYGSDTSSLPGYSFSSNQYGVEVSYSF